MQRIYLDHAATTPLLPEVTEAMMQWADCGNPSSLYAEGRRAKAEIDLAREAVADALGCLFGEITFTSSGTEASNLAIVGCALQNQHLLRNRILMGAVEHHCVLNCREVLERIGYQVELIPVDRFARIKLDDLTGMLAGDVLLVCAMHANNEIGTINDIHAISHAARSSGALVFCDAVQTFLSLPGQLAKSFSDVDLIAISAHKVNGPKGVGALFVRSGVKIQPLLSGGGQEREMRAGTENVAAIAGFAAAVKHRSTSIRVAPRDAFVQAIKNQSCLKPIWTAGPSIERTLPAHAHLRFPGLNAESMLIVLDRLGVCASSGAACSSGSIEPSHVLLACGYTKSEALEGLRFSFGTTTSMEASDEAAARVAQAVAQVSSGKSA